MTIMLPLPSVSRTVAPSSDLPAKSQPFAGCTTTPDAMLTGFGGTPATALSPTIAARNRPTIRVATARVGIQPLGGRVVGVAWGRYAAAMARQSTGWGE